MQKRKGKLNIQSLFRAIVGGVSALVLLLSLPFFLYLILIREGGIVIPVLLVMDILSLVLLWRTRDLFFGRQEITEDGIVNKCFCRRTVFVPWEEIESIKIGGHFTGCEVETTNGSGYNVALNAENVELLQKYMPQRLKDMLGPYAFD